MKALARTFKALSDETRLRILALLHQGELCVCDLMAALDLPQSTVSRHLSYLRNAGLVEDQRQGVWMFYRLSRDLPTLGPELTALLWSRLNDHPQAQRDLAVLDQAALTRKNRCN